MAEPEVKQEDEHLRAVSSIGNRYGQPETLQTIIRDFQSLKERLERWQQDQKRTIG